MISSLQYLGVKTQHHFVSSSYMFLEKKTLLRIWINLGLNLTIFRGTGPWCVISGWIGEFSFRSSLRSKRFRASSSRKLERERKRDLEKEGWKGKLSSLVFYPPSLPLGWFFSLLFFFFGSCSNFRRTTQAEPLPTQDYCVVILSPLLLCKIRIPINYSDFNFLILSAESRNFTAFLFS